MLSILLKLRDLLLEIKKQFSKKECIFSMFFFIIATVIVIALIQSNQDKNNIDIVSLQISLLGIIITTITVSVTLLSFLGWSEIKKIIDEKIEEKVKIAVNKLGKDYNERMDISKSLEGASEGIDMIKEIEKENIPQAIFNKDIKHGKKQYTKSSKN